MCGEFLSGTFSLERLPVLLLSGPTQVPSIEKKEFLVSVRIPDDI